MRLLTFQHRDLLFKALKEGTARAPYDIYRKVKKMHEQFYYDDNSDGETYRPLYCYAYCYNKGTPSIEFIISRWADLMGVMRFAHMEDCFIELNVPDEEILTFSGHTGQGETISLASAKRLCQTYQPRYGDDLDALIPYIKAEWVASYTLYEDKGYQPQLLTPIILQPHAFPMYVKPIVVSGQGYVLNPATLDEEENYAEDPNGFMANHSHKPNVCSDDENYHNANEYLLSDEGALGLGEELFDNSDYDKELYKLSSKYTVGGLRGLRHTLGRPLCKEDLENNNPIVNVTNEF